MTFSPKETKWDFIVVWSAARASPVVMERPTAFVATVLFAVRPPFLATENEPA